jgi:hypothetical protein
MNFTPKAGAKHDILFEQTGMQNLHYLPCFLGTLESPLGNVWFCQVRISPTPFFKDTRSTFLAGLTGQGDLNRDPTDWLHGARSSHKSTGTSANSYLD